MIETDSYIGEADDGEQIIDSDEQVVHLFAAADGNVGEAVGLEDGEVVAQKQGAIVLCSQCQFHADPNAPEDGTCPMCGEDALTTYYPSAD
jgi:hypothetical protein